MGVRIIVLKPVSTRILTETGVGKGGWCLRNATKLQLGSKVSGQWTLSTWAPAVIACIRLSFYNSLYISMTRTLSLDPLYPCSGPY